jgi:hypothetical protein
MRSASGWGCSAQVPEQKPHDACAALRGVVTLDMSSDADALREEPVPYSPPPETQRLVDELYRKEVLEARAMAPLDKLLAGQALFEAACRVTLAGIRHQNPDLSEDRCLEILRERLELQRRLEETS